jgi:hypothetical protein
MTLTELQASARLKVSHNCTSAGYPDAKLNPTLNEWYRIIFGWVLLQSGIWEPSGEQYTTDLVSGQSEYILPSGLIVLKRLEIKYPGMTSYVTMNKLDDFQTNSSFRNGDFSFATADHSYYRVFDRSVFIFPTPTANVTSGLSLETVNDVVSLSGSSDIPDLNPLIHRAVAIGAAMDYCNSNERLRQGRLLKEELMGVAGGSVENTLKDQIEKLAAMRDQSARPAISVHYESYD